MDEGVRGRVDEDDVRAKVSGEGPRRDAAPVGARDAGPDTIPESSVDSRSAPTSAQLTADASGARLIIPALSLRDAIANGPLFDAPPLDGSPPSPEAIRAAKAGVAERLEPTAPVKRRRRRHASLGLWLAASALVGLGLLASTTETADRVAARIQLAFQNDAIPAARADSTVCAGEFLQAGDYHRAEADTIHPVTSSEQGCLALVMTSSKNEPIR